MSNHEHQPNVTQNSPLLTPHIQTNHHTSTASLFTDRETWCRPICASAVARAHAPCLLGWYHQNKNNCACECDCPLLDNHQIWNNPSTSMHLYIHCRQSNNVEIAKIRQDQYKICLFSILLLRLLLIHSLACRWIVLEIYASTTLSLLAMTVDFHGTILQGKDEN